MIPHQLAMHAALSAVDGCVLLVCQLCDTAADGMGWGRETVALHQAVFMWDEHVRRAHT